MAVAWLIDNGTAILTKCLWPVFMEPHFDYWWSFDNNIQELRVEIVSLNVQTRQIQQKNPPGVEEWLETSTKKLAEAQRILPDDNMPKACALCSRYSMGKKAKETAEEISKHRQLGSLFPTADPAPLDPSTPDMKFPFDEWTMEFESRKSIEKDIIDSLESKSVGMIGICGIGGVGKTIMAQRIGKTVKDKNLFDEVGLVTDIQDVDVPEIQNKIAYLLGLKFAENDGEFDRKGKLRQRLMDKRRKIIILDGVWESLRFENLGIYIESNFERCKVILTSRSKDTFNGINHKKVFELPRLEDREAWDLFRKKAGDSVDKSPISWDVANKVVKIFNGLPKLLSDVVLDLGYPTNDSSWRNSLSKLQKVDQDSASYRCLKLSYDRLDKSLDAELMKKLFLVCCLFPKDFNIPVQELTWYWMGCIDCVDLQRFNGMSIEQATNLTVEVVEKLKNRYLLIDGRDNLHVKMLDLVRDVAICIGSEELNGFLESFTSEKKSSSDNCNWMSLEISNVRMEVPVSSSLFPKLRLLMLLNSSSIQFSDISFEGMKDLNVLSFQSTWIGSLPRTLRSLKNLQTLCLVNCKVENISDIGELTSLKFFSCYECENITELPKEIGKLSGLRLLELNECRKLLTIPFGIILRLVELEKLKIRGSFSKWKTGEEMGNAAVTELERLTKLTCLEIEISDWDLAAKNIQLSEKLVKYWIRIGSDHNRFKQRDYGKVMILNLAGAVGNWIPLRARDAESLTLRGDGSEKINLAGTASLRNLEFSECLRVKKLVKTKDCNSGIVFRWLETLRLSKLKNLEEICERGIIPNQNDSLRKLESIEITSCHKLKSLFSVLMARCLSQLEVLEIESCEAMEQVFRNEIRHHNTDGCIKFPKLKRLRLENLPNLTAFCQELENIIIEFLNLTQMEIRGLPKLNSLFALNSETPENACFHFLCNPKDVSFCNLKSIRIIGCDNLRSLFSVSVAGKCLLQLEVLEIRDCKSMEQVFWNKGTDDNTDGCIGFPNLKQLILVNLQNLTEFCQELENIVNLEIRDLPNLKDSVFPLNSQTLCNLKFIKIVSCSLLRSLFSVSVARICLIQLEVLEIADCDKLEQVFWDEMGDHREAFIELPNLKKLTIVNLQNLKDFCQLENIIIKFPNLTEMKIAYLPKLKSVSSQFKKTP